MQVPTALAGRTRNYSIEGPTGAESRKMAARRQELLAKAQAALTAGNDDQAFEYDCAALDIETDLASFGFAKLI